MEHDLIDITMKNSGRLRAGDAILFADDAVLADCLFDNRRIAVSPEYRSDWETVSLDYKIKNEDLPKNPLAIVDMIQEKRNQSLTTIVKKILDRFIEKAGGIDKKHDWNLLVLTGEFLRETVVALPMSAKIFLDCTFVILPHEEWVAECKRLEEKNLNRVCPGLILSRE